MSGHSYVCSLFVFAFVGLCFKCICFSFYTNRFLYFIFFLILWFTLITGSYLEIYKSCERSILWRSSLGDQGQSLLSSLSTPGTPLTSNLEMLRNSVLCFIEVIKQHCSCWTPSIISREAML